MQFAKVVLEDWMRRYYFETPLDLGSSGVYPYSFSELRELAQISDEDLNSVVFDDSLTLGALPLRRAIAARWGNGDPDCVMAANGSNEATFLLMTSLLRPGDEVVTLEPIYHTLDKIAQALGCHLRRCPLRWENGFALDMDEFLSLISPSTRMVVINFPHNPTGTSLSVTAQDRLIAACAEHQTLLVWDAALQELVFDEAPLPSPFPRYQHAIVIGTLSKAFGLPGLRVGWCIGQRQYLEPCMQWKDYTSLYVSPWVEGIAQRAIEHADALLAPRKQEAARNLRHLEAWLTAHHDLVEWVKPMGGVTAFVRLRELGDTQAFCQSLATDKGVMLVPGVAFNHPSHARLGYGGREADFQAGLLLLAEHLRAWRSRTPSASLDAAQPFAFRRGF